MMLTVAICTFNRAERLRAALASLVEANAPDVPWELLVVDNNSSDDTSTVAEAFAPSLPLRYVFEPEQGLSAARDRAMTEAWGDWLLFTDDDVLVDRDWLVHYFAAMRRFPDAGFLGGRVRPYWPEGRPRWVRDERMSLIAGLLVCYDLGEEGRAYAPGDPLPFGASFALHRAVFESVGGFRRDLGVKGGALGRGEETEYLERVRAGGWNGAYVGGACVRHWTDPRRLTLAYLLRYGYHKGRSGGGSRRSLWRRSVGAGGFLLRGLVQLLRGRGDRFRQSVINAGIVLGVGSDVRS